MQRVILIAEGATGVSALEALAPEFEVCAVFRSNRDRQCPIAEMTARLGIPLLADTHPQSIHSAIVQLAPDAVVISSYNRIIPPETLRLCPFINVHYAALPAYRGRASVNWAILNRESHTAITIHRIDAGLDSGNILFQRLVPIASDSTATTIYDELNAIQKQELAAAVRRFLAGYGGEEQPGPATYGCTRLPEDGEIDWSASTLDIDARVRALAFPFPGAHTYLSLRRIVVLRAAIVADAPAFRGRVPGRVTRICFESGSVQVLTGDGVLEIQEISTGEGDRLPAATLIRSTRQTLGLTKQALLQRLCELEMRIAQLGLDVSLPEPELAGVPRSESKFTEKN